MAINLIGTLKVGRSSSVNVQAAPARDVEIGEMVVLDGTLLHCRQGACALEDCWAADRGDGATVVEIDNPYYDSEAVDPTVVAALGGVNFWLDLATNTDPFSSDVDAPNGYTKVITTPVATSVYLGQVEAGQSVTVGDACCRVRLLGDNPSPAANFTTALA